MKEILAPWLGELGIRAEMEHFAFAAALVGIAVLLGHLAARWAGPALDRWTQAKVGVRDQHLGRRLTHVVRYAIGALALVYPLVLVPFETLPQMVLAAGCCGAVAMLLYHVLRIAGVPGWTCSILSAALFVILVGAAVGGMEPVTDALDDAALNVGTRRISLLSVVTFMLVAALLFAATRIANRVVTHSVGRLTALDLSQRVLIQKVGSLVIVVVAILFGIDVLGIDLTTLTVFSGALGLAVGFGLQKTFGNLIAGLILLMDRSVKPGDVVAVGNTFGAINKIGVRAVSVITRDGKEHLIPNEQLMTTSVENWSFSSRDVRIHIPVTISYGSDLQLAQKLMIEAAKSAHRVLPQPEPTVWLLAFGDRGLEHDIMVWIIDPEQGVGNVQSEILNKLWALFRANGIGLPYPQQDIYVHEVPEHGAGSANLSREHRVSRDETDG